MRPFGFYWFNRAFSLYLLPAESLKPTDKGADIAGVAFLPASVSYLIGTNLFGLLANKMGRYGLFWCISKSIKPVINPRLSTLGF